MTAYRLTWSMEVDAENPVFAAVAAERGFLDQQEQEFPGGWWEVYLVDEPEAGRIAHVDLEAARQMFAPATDPTERTEA